jgi:magnesium-transporting ATPase (P-type)
MTAAAASSAGPRMSARGLTSAEARDLLARHGSNVLPRPRRRSGWRKLAEQLTHFFALLLWAAAGLAVVAGMPQLGVAIAVVVIINGVFAFAQEYRADRAGEKLQDLLPSRAAVRRDGRRTVVDSRDLVPGDVVLLGAGDRVSADLEVVEGHGLTLDTALLTGESVPEALDTGDALPAGTFVVEGEGAAVVTATGDDTRLAGIARLAREVRRPPSPLARELHRVVRGLAVIAVSVGAAFFGVSLLVGLPVTDGFLFAVGVTVALVPEGLLPTVTLSLAVGAQRMARRHALVRRMDCVETLGATTYVCTDKTGTLTRNEMSVVEVWTPEGTVGVPGAGYDPSDPVEPPDGTASRLRRLAAASVRCSSGHAARRADGSWAAVGDPMEAALDAFALRVGVDTAAVRDAPVLRRFAFDPRRRMTSVVDPELVAVKGAPDAVLARCRSAPVDAAGEVDRMAARGLRLLAVARRTGPGVAAATGDAAEVERDLDLLGVVGFRDPPRPHVAGALARCRQAGIRVAMITGDHPATALAVAAEVGLAGPDALLVEGRDLPADEAVLGALLDRDGVVVARVSPEDKLRIARALRARGHVVAMTGDGVNDGPALQEADVGVAMGASGTDVARESADLVLLDDDFTTVVAAVEQGRATSTNIRRFLTYHLTDNVAELTPFAVWALSGGRFPLALGVLQVLALDIGTDLLPALALGAEPPGRDALRRGTGRRRLLDASLLRRVFGVLGPAEAVVEMAAFTAVMAAAGWRPGGPVPAAPVLAAASGAAFTAVVVGQLAAAFACRSEHRPPWRLHRRGNRLLVVAVVVEVAALAAFLGIPPLAGLLGHAVPPAGGWAVALTAAPAVLVADALDKAVRRRGQRPPG